MIIIIIVKIKRLNGEALEISRRPKAGQQGGCGGAGAPPLPMISRRPKAGQQGGSGGAEPPRHYPLLQQQQEQQQQQQLL